MYAIDKGNQMRHFRIIFHKKKMSTAVQKTFNPRIMADLLLLIAMDITKRKRKTPKIEMVFLYASDAKESIS